MKRFKQIMAVTAIVIILGLYLTTLVLAILGNSVSHSLFMASLYATVIVPAMLYIFFCLAKLLRREDTTK